MAWWRRMDQSSGEGARLLLPRPHPLMAQHLLESQPQGHVRLEDLADDALGERGHGDANARAEEPVARHLVLEEFPQILVVERHPGVEHDEENDAERPHVRQFRIVRNGGDDFRCGVGRRAAVRLTEHPPALVVHAEPGETEVRQFHIEFPRQEYVLALEVPVGDVLAVQVVQARGHLAEPQPRLLLRHYAVIPHEVEQVAVVGVAHEDENTWTALQDTMYLRT